MLGDHFRQRQRKMAAQPGRAGADPHGAERAVAQRGDFVAGILDLDMHGLGMPQQRRANGVSATPRGSRSNSFTPSWSSSSLMLLVSVGCVMLSSAAAVEMFLRCATRRKYSSCRRSMGNPWARPLALRPERTVSPALDPDRACTASKHGEEFQQRLAIIRAQLAECAGCGSAVAIMRQNCLGECYRPAIVQEARAQAQAPERRGSPFRSRGAALNNAVIEGGAHVVQQQIRIERNLAAPGRQRRRMAGHATGGREQEAGLVI